MIKITNNFRFMFATQSNTNFSVICGMSATDLPGMKELIRKMPYEEVIALKQYAEQRGSIGSMIWAEAELQRRDFILKQLSLILSILAVIISVIALSA